TLGFLIWDFEFVSSVGFGISSLTARGMGHYVRDGMTSELLVLLGIIVAASSGVPGLFLGRHSISGQWTAMLLSVSAAALGLTGVAAFWAGQARPFELAWAIPGAELSAGVDGLSAIFLVPIFLISLLGSIYGLGYWRQAEHSQNGRKL